MNNETRVSKYTESPVIKPQLDFMLLELEKRDSSIVLIDNKPDNADVFNVKDVGPGYWLDGSFIKNTVSVGDKVFIVGNLFTLKYKGIEYSLARSREVIAIVKLRHKWQ